MPFTICFNLDESEILSSGNELNGGIHDLLSAYVTTLEGSKILSSGRDLNY